MLAAFAAGGTAQAACEPRVRNAPDTAIIEYDPFLPGATVRELIFDVANAGSTPCTMDFAVLGPGDQPERLFRLGALVLELAPPEEDGRLLLTERPGVYRVTVPPEGAVRVGLDAVVLQDAVVDAGDHVFEPSFEFYEVGTIRPIGDRWQSEIVLRSPPRAQLNITGASGSFGSGASVSVVDFGEAETGAERRIFLQVRANTLSRLTISSAHRGELRHAAAPDTARPIPYEVALDGVPLDLAETVQQERDPPRTLEGRSLPMDITLGEIGGAMAGRYEDTLTIEFSPL